MPEAKARNWSTKTLARELAKFMIAKSLTGRSTIAILLDSLKVSIVEEEAGVDLDSLYE